MLSNKLRDLSSAASDGHAVDAAAALALLQQWPQRICICSDGGAGLGAARRGGCRRVGRLLRRRRAGHLPLALGDERVGWPLQALQQRCEYGSALVQVAALLASRADV